jgi:iron(III) transport system substrate-binding protein
MIAGQVLAASGRFVSDSLLGKDNQLCADPLPNANDASFFCPAMPKKIPGVWGQSPQLLLLILAIVVSLGCSRSSQPEVVVYVAVDRSTAEPILEAFQRESGIQVKAVYDAEAAKTTGLVTRLLAEGERPRCDVFWNNEIVQTLLLADRGLLDEYRSPDAAGIPDFLKDESGRWTGVAVRARVIVYNTNHVTEDEAPKSIRDLADPRWRGKAAMADPRFGTTRTHVAALFAQLGADEAKEYLQSLLDNEIRVVDGNAMVKNLVARAQPGASPVFVGLTDTDDVLAGQAEGEPIAMIYPDQDSLGTLVIPSTVCLIRGAPHENEARNLVDYLVSRRVETKLTAPGTGYYAVRTSSGDQSESAAPQITQFDVSFAEIYEQLAPSSAWVEEHFH